MRNRLFISVSGVLLCCPCCVDRSTVISGAEMLPSWPLSCWRCQGCRGVASPNFYRPPDCREVVKWGRIIWRQGSMSIFLSSTA